MHFLTDPLICLKYNQRVNMVSYLIVRVPFEGEGESPSKALVFLFHWRTMLETEREPDSDSKELVVLVATSAPGSPMACFWLILPATLSVIGLARRRKAETWKSRRRKKSPDK